jgi:hypothetical protein
MNDTKKHSTGVATKMDIMEGVDRVRARNPMNANTTGKMTVPMRKADFMAG